MTRAERYRREYRAYIRDQAGARSHVPIVTVDGDAGPHIEGECHHYETPSGDIVWYPNAYRRAFGRPIYCASTVAVNVGRKWLAAHHIPLTSVE